MFGFCCVVGSRIVGFFVGFIESCMVYDKVVCGFVVDCKCFIVCVLYLEDEFVVVYLLVF